MNPLFAPLDSTMLLAIGCAIVTSPAFLRSVDRLENHGECVLFERQPFERIVLCRTLAAVLSLGSLAGTSSRRYQ
jgi:hypothetical protein